MLGVVKKTIIPLFCLKSHRSSRTSQTNFNRMYFTVFTESSVKGIVSWCLKTVENYLIHPFPGTNFSTVYKIN